MDYNRILRNVGEITCIVNKLERIEEILTFEAYNEITAEEAIHDIKHTLGNEEEFTSSNSVKEGYIVPFSAPTNCATCPFSACEWSIPWYSADERRGKKSVYCQIDTEDRHLELDFHDITTKAEWCPLIKVGTSNDE